MSAKRITEHFDAMVQEVLADFPAADENAVYDLSVGLDTFDIEPVDGEHACDDCGMDHVQDLCVRFVLAVSLEGVCSRHPGDKTTTVSQWALPLVDLLGDDDRFRMEVKQAYEHAVFALQAHSMDDLDQLG